MESDKKVALKELGMKIAKIRISKEISGIQLSRMLGKHDAYMAKVESGVFNVGYFTLIEICECLGIDIKDLI